jgi:phenylacetate-CoA ligase
MRASGVFSREMEMRDRAAQRAWLEERLRATVARAYEKAPAVRRALDGAGVKPGEIRTLDDLQRIPVTRKDALGSLQAAEPPFAGLLTVSPGELQRVFASPGPTFVPQGPADDYWRFRMAFAACGIRAGDIVINTLAYHLTPGGFMLDSGLRSLGCVVISAGTGSTDLQVKLASHTRAAGYAGTPSFLRTLLHRGRELNLPLRIEVAFATAEMLPESLRKELETDFGIRVLQGYATADLGVLAYECAEKDGMHLQPECIVEILDLETGRPATPGEPGHVVGTTFDSGYPLLRFATGDVSALAPDAPCACGRTAPKLKGLLGRVGDAIKVRGMFVRASMIEEVMKRFPAVARFQAVVTREQHHDELAYQVELAEGAAVDTEQLVEALRAAVNIRGEVRIGPVAPNAPKLDDRRVWK